MSIPERPVAASGGTDVEFRAWPESAYCPMCGTRLMRDPDSTYFTCQKDNVVWVRLGFEWIAPSLNPTPTPPEV